MARTIVLDSAPLGLVVHRQGMPLADQCRAWVADHVARGDSVVVPAIVDYDLRRELIRIGKTIALRHLDSFEAAVPDRFLPLTTAALHRAAELWAQVRNQGLPTSHAHDPDVDVILAAQAIELGLPPTNFVIATTNVRHVSRFAPADLWTNV